MRSLAVAFIVISLLGLVSTVPILNAQHDSATDQVEQPNDGTVSTIKQKCVEAAEALVPQLKELMDTAQVKGLHEYYAEIIGTITNDYKVAPDDLCTITVETRLGPLVIPMWMAGSAAVGWLAGQGKRGTEDVQIPDGRLGPLVIPAWMAGSAALGWLAGSGNGKRSAEHIEMPDGRVGPLVIPVWMAGSAALGWLAGSGNGRRSVEDVQMPEGRLGPLVIPAWMAGSAALGWLAGSGNGKRNIDDGIVGIVVPLASVEIAAPVLSAAKLAEILKHTIGSLPESVQKAVNTAL